MDQLKHIMLFRRITCTREHACALVACKYLHCITLRSFRVFVVLFMFRRHDKGNCCVPSGCCPQSGVQLIDSTGEVLYPPKVRSAQCAKAKVTAQHQGRRPSPCYT